ncbi:hypothetical protein [Streptomyces sp. NPDC048349]|uniref:hypothetical protein n=1 Tax=Streptomyces sp. NPDC048349 TaxID=3155486 RepID=UPI00343A6781
MSTPSAAPRPAEAQEKPGWSLTAFLFGTVCAVLRLGGDWSWWALLWAPILVLAVGSAAYEWVLLARHRWRMGLLEWGFLVLSHLGFAACLGGLWLAGR